MLRTFSTSGSGNAIELLFPAANRKRITVEKPTRASQVLLVVLCVTAPKLCSAVDEGAAGAVPGPRTEEALLFDGDLRYRYESIESDEVSFDRQRVRARLGVKADVNPSTRAVFRISTGEGDPRSAHITFSGGYSRKEVGVDLAYLEWIGQAEITAKAGKIPFPTWRPAMSYFTGGDFNPEGIALNYGSQSGFYCASYNFWLEDRSTSSDSGQRGVQIGWRAPGEGSASSIAMTLNDFTTTRNQRPFLDGDNAYGNSVNPDGTLASDFRIIDMAAEWTTEFYLGSVTAFAHFAHNTEADAGADAYAGGFQLRTQSRSRWSAGYQYARVGRDALFGQHFDGDFGGGRTGSKGHVLHAAFQPAARMNARLSYFVNDVTQQNGTQHPFRLLQLDIDCFF